MILVLNLNASLDKMYRIPRLERGKVMRVRAENTAGGKGFHVANVIYALGESVVAMGFLGGHTGKIIRELWEEKGIQSVFVPITDESRCCININDEDGQQTEILENGPILSAREAQIFLQHYENLLPKANIIVASGSLPQGLPLNFYRHLIRAAQKQGKKFLLDTSGATLAESLLENPYFVKPNQEEIEALTGHVVQSFTDAAREVQALQAQGIAFPVLTLGEQGACAGLQKKLYRAKAPQIKVQNAVGSGDAFTAGIAVALKRNYQPEDALRLGIASGAANAELAESGQVHSQRVSELFRQVQVEII